jgi:acyl transferase domain-containing protein/NADPH:quinone reductase-like Zn-dependent oxidoreductase/acyl carrier protein
MATGTANREEDLNEPIAIIGMGCCYPGGARTPDELWKLLDGGVDAITEFPSNRGWDMERLFHPDPDHPRTSYAREGGFVLDADEFDAPFFSIGPREALAMDPQQRLLLETSWEAIESAGVDPESLRGSKSGVFAGIASTNYGLSMEIPPELEGHLLTGTTTSVASGRIAYTLGFEGPTMSIDTACSSSLLATHLACRALRQGECSLALAGGVTIFATPAVHIAFSRQRGLSEDGRCRSFAAAADGVGWSEGSGMVLLETLSEARRNGHRVLATIRGSATNQDGASHGLSAPSLVAQERVIREALADAGVAAADVEAVEAHGTGTVIGDPIEALALLDTYGQERRDGPLWLGSMKSNIGHSVAAAGVGGVIKMVLALREERLPGTLHVDRPNPQVDWSRGEVELLTEGRDWPGNGQPRRAGISSFGISGSNVHMIVEEAPPADEEEGRPPALGGEPAPAASKVPFLISAKDDLALLAQAQRLHTRVSEDPDLSPLDLAYSLARTRTHFRQRAAILGGSREDLLRGLDMLRGAGLGAGVVRGEAQEGRTAFMFSGQGAQNPGMGRELCEAFPDFAAAFDEVCAELDRHLERPLREVMFAEEGTAEADLLDSTAFAQPALFALEVALFELLASFGFEPDFLIGHSIGELSAAHVAGVLSLADAAKLVTARGRLMGALPGEGAMLAVEASEEELTAMLDELPGELAIAAVNGPRAAVASGAVEGIERLERECAEQGRGSTRLRVSHAFHSPLMEPMLEELAEIASGLDYSPPRIPIVSNLTGAPAGEELTDPDYWVRHVHSTVRFGDGVTALRQDGVTHFLELGPAAVLAAMARQSLSPEEGERTLVAAALRAGRPEAETFEAFLATAHCRGVAVDWESCFSGSGARRVPLPTYAFQRQHYWLELRLGIGDVTLLGQVPTGHRLLSTALGTAGGGGWIFSGSLSLERHPWLADHAVLGSVLFPATGFIELALCAGRQVGAEEIEEMTFEVPMLIAEEEPLQVQVTVEEPDENGKRAIAVHSRQQRQAEAGDASWICHVRGTLVPAPANGRGVADRFPPKIWPPEGAEPIETEFLYERLVDRGYDYGGAFQGVVSAWRRGDELFGQVTLDDVQAHAAEDYVAHPALLDSALHLALAAALESEAGKILVPFSVRGVRCSGDGASSLRLRLTLTESGGLRLDGADLDSETAIEIGELMARPVDVSALQGGGAALDGSLYRLNWVPRVSPPQQDRQFRVGALGAGELPAAERRFEDPAAVAAAVAAGDGPDVVLFDAAGDAEDGQIAAAAHESVRRTLAVLQAWLAEEALTTVPLIVLTRGGARALESETPDPAAAAALGLVRSAQSERPGAFAAVDLEPGSAGEDIDWGALLTLGEPQLAVRGDSFYAPRLDVLRRESVLMPPAEESAWCLASAGAGTLEDLTLVAPSQLTERLEAGQVRIAVRAAGLNFRDVLLALNNYAGQALIGSEAAGIVTEIGKGVKGVKVGDRVMGLIPGSIGSVALADHHTLVPLPEDWSFTEGASMPLAFLTAYYGLFDLAGLELGEKVLIHAGAGGVGMAAIQLARHRGAEVFATASPSKWQALRDLGLDDDHIASSRDLEFREKFLAATGGEGVDVALNALAGDFVDASLDLLPRGGRFVEMGKADVRDAEAVAGAHPGVEYQSFDVAEAGLERLQAILGELVDLFATGSLRLAPIVTWDVRRAIEAFRYLRDGRNTGKIVLTIPRSLDPDGTVLITGGTGALGGEVARHLAGVDGVRHLLLVGRRGPAAEGAEALRTELAELGCEAEIAACDVADRAQMQELLDSIPPQRPLTGVVHAAGLLDDGVIDTLSPDQVDRVLRPKVDAAMALHELTSDLDLAQFVMFSSGSATMGNPGQGNYAAANSFLDALAASRGASGLPGQSLAWGLWSQEGGGMSGGLEETDLARLERLGILPLSSEEGLQLFDLSRAVGEPLLVPVRLDIARLRSFAAAGLLPPLLRSLVRAPLRRERTGGRSLERRLSGLPEEDWPETVLETVRAEVALVLGYDSADAIDPAVEFKDLGFDSLAAVELYNRLCQTTGLRLPVTMGFDHPTPEAAAAFICAEMKGGGEEEEPSGEAEEQPGEEEDGQEPGEEEGQEPGDAEEEREPGDDGQGPGDDEQPQVDAEQTGVPS